MSCMDTNRCCVCWRASRRSDEEPVLALTRCCALHKNVAAECSVKEPFLRRLEGIKEPVTRWRR